MGDRLSDLEGVGPAHAATLAEHGLATTDDLLARGARPAGRAALAEATGISEKLILEWVNHADLFRIRGVAGQYADLLEAAGVDTVVELARRNAANLAAALAETNASRNLVNRVPSATEVADWVAQAKDLPRGVFYDDTAAGDSGALAPAAEAAPQPSAEPARAAEPAPLAATTASPVSAEPAEAVQPAPGGPEVSVAPAPVTPAAHVPAAVRVEGAARPDSAPATAPRSFTTPAVAPESRGWLSRLLDRIRGR